jgi:RHS repeat-associated protein
LVLQQFQPGDKRCGQFATGQNERWSWANRYRSEYTYDANGNIVSANRYDKDENHYDEFSYKYEKRGGRVVRNRLYQLNDIADQPDAFVNEAGGAQDIGWTGNVAFNEEHPAMNTAYNYGYDALGNLIRDTREGITNIDWTVAGKVRSVAKATGPSLAFAYGASGQRTMKQVSDPDLDEAGHREHYIRDAQGNIMATYRYTNTAAASLKLNERPLYGSSRLGSLRTELELHSLPSFDPTSANPVQQVDLNYELTDHLGNVCAVVTGRLLDGNGGGTPKQAELVSAQGYEAFGSLLPGRNYSSGSYRYLFQGQEHDDEINGATGTSYAFEYRIHDPRVGRFLSIDPLAAKYPHNSPYAFSENRVIDAFELEGLESVTLNDGSKIETGPASFDAQLKAFESSPQAQAGGYVTEWADGTRGLAPVEVKPGLPSMPSPSETGGQGLAYGFDVGPRVIGPPPPDNIGFFREPTAEERARSPFGGLLKDISLPIINLTPIGWADNFIATASDENATAGDIARASIYVTGRGPVKLSPHPRAQGPHTSFRTSNGRVTNFEIYGMRSNGEFYPVLRFRGEGRPHGGVNPPMFYRAKAGKGPGAPLNRAMPPGPDDILPPGY